MLFRDDREIAGAQAVSRLGIASRLARWRKEYFFGAPEAWIGAASIATMRGTAIAPHRVDADEVDLSRLNLPQMELDLSDDNDSPRDRKRSASDSNVGAQRAAEPNSTELAELHGRRR
jgi:hypothetical protein